MSEDFGDFTIEAVRKPIAGVTDVEIPAALAEMLAAQTPKALADKDFELAIKAKDEATAKKIALWSRAWGAKQEPKLYIHKIPNTRAMGANMARLAVELDSEVTADNRPGRKVNK